jgi:hypothetical protein
MEQIEAVLAELTPDQRLAFVHEAVKELETARARLAVGSWDPIAAAQPRFGSVAGG